MCAMFSGQQNPLQVADDNRVLLGSWANKTQVFVPISAADVKQEPGTCNWQYRQAAEKVQCNTCSKLYASKKSLKIHNRIHTGYKPYACPICPKRFTQTNVLKAHINYHTGRRDWLCKICGKAFTQSAHLRTHEKTHSNRKDYQCPYCQHNFSCKGVRDRHIRQHTGEKPYKCLLCEKRFTRGESLKFHENAHQGIRPYSCPHEHCRKTFTKQSSLKRHIRSAHSGLASSFRVRSAKFSSPLAHVSGCSAIFPTTVASPSANSDCVSTTGSSTAGPDSPFVIKMEELDEDDTEDQLLQNMIQSLSAAELDRLDQYLGLSSTDASLESFLNGSGGEVFDSFVKMEVDANDVARPGTAYPTQNYNGPAYSGHYGMNMWDPVDWEMPEHKVFDRPCMSGCDYDRKFPLYQMSGSSVYCPGPHNLPYSTGF